MKKSDFRDGLTARLPRLLLILCLLQPMLDMLSFWQDTLGWGNTLTTVLRFAMLAAVVSIGFACSGRKGVYLVLGGVLAVLTAGHVAACLQWGYDAPWKDLANLLRIYQLPLMTVSLITMIEVNPGGMQALKRGFFWCLLICAAVEALSVLTGTNPYTYPDKEVGILGWFYFPNSQSAILAMLVPVAVTATLHKKYLGPITIVTGGVVLYCFATRLSYVALIGCFVVLALGVVVLRRQSGVAWKRTAALLMAVAVAAAAGYSVSPMTKNAQMVAKNKVLKQLDIEEKVSWNEAQAQEQGLEGEALAAARLEDAYETYLTGPTGRFGLERTAKWYGYSTDAGDIADVRREKLTFNQMLLEDNPGLSLWFGLEREDLTYEDESYDAENDFHGIFYLCGITGLGAMVIFLGYFLVRMLAALRRDFCGTMTLDALGCGLAIGCGLLHAYCTAGVLRRPNASFYLAALLAMAYHMTQRNMVKNEVDA